MYTVCVMRRISESEISAGTKITGEFSFSAFYKLVKLTYNKRLAVCFFFKRMAYVVLNPKRLYFFKKEELLK